VHQFAVSGIVLRHRAAAARHRSLEVAQRRSSRRSVLGPGHFPALASDPAALAARPSAGPATPSGTAPGAAVACTGAGSATAPPACRPGALGRVGVSPGRRRRDGVRAGRRGCRGAAGPGDGVGRSLSSGGFCLAIAYVAVDPGGG
jgi:hypothetical protein